MLNLAARQFRFGNDGSGTRPKLTLPHIGIQVFVFLTQLQLQLLQSLLKSKDVISVRLILLLELLPLLLSLIQQLVELIAGILELLLQSTGCEYFLIVLLLCQNGFVPVLQGQLLKLVQSLKVPSFILLQLE